MRLEHEQKSGAILVDFIPSVSLTWIVAMILRKTKVMALSGKSTDKLVFALLYACVIALASWGGIRLINYSLDSKFYRDFLLKWDISIRNYSREIGDWPIFTGSNHLKYMEKLTKALKGSSFPAPKSNTNRSFIYRMNKIGSTDEQLFLLCFANRIIVYGMSKETFERVDNFVDGKISAEKGFFSGYPSKDKKTYIGLLKL